MPHSRRLAAIMFADIVGYMAMMQHNEQEGLANVRQFSRVVEQQVKEHEDEVLQFMGDDYLCVFQFSYMSLGDMDSALVYLDQAVQQKDVGIIFINDSDFIIPYIDDSRIQAILKRIHQPNEEQIVSDRL